MWLSRLARVECEVADLIRYAEACAWWATLQENRPSPNSDALYHWLDAVGQSYVLVQSLAKRVHLPDLQGEPQRCIAALREAIAGADVEKKSRRRSMF